ncbi:hypothetical protein CAC42_582 [Sphaceloma murrayae]|uniref:Apple domain-containing protein n=1 Tax=Sphaceloma murrayae TaxID=2082308 RepID=A0A2K1R3W2_9PEZI|nr:hypothetical protein CAC42_582 [Sphaceloma murrayae]
MKFVQALAGSLLLVQGVVAYPSSLQGKSTCSTSLTTKQINPVPKTLKTEINTQTVTGSWKTTITASTTMTAAISTVTKNPFTTDITTNSTSYIYSTVSGAYTYNITKLVFTTVTTDYTSTSFAKETTVTLSPSTWTVPPSSGFTPAQSLLPTAVAKRSPQDKNKKLKAKAKSFPGRIDCTTYKLSKTTITPGAQPTTTLTSTVVQKAITTTFNLTRTHFASTLTLRTVTWTTTQTRNVTQTRTETATRTHTAVATQTATSTPPALGYIYSACDADNLLNYTVAASGSGPHYAITSFDGGAAQLSILHSESAYECCTRCVNGANCGGAIFTRGTCFLQTFGQCANQSANVFGTFGYDASNPTTEDKYIIINGFCGRWKYGG